jgi:pimeloyl-ACP methyl ester carboxylesterase
MKKTHAIWFAATFALFFSACSSDKNTGTGAISAAGTGATMGGSGGTATAGAGASTATGEPDFDTCFAAVKPMCLSHDMNTAALMETPCREITMVPVPLTAGGNYGPATMKYGPYGGKAEWNQGAGTEFVNPVNGSEPICLPTGVESFREPASLNAEILNTRDADYSLYTIFRPACFKPGEKYPVITWANGTCGQIAGYAPLLSAVASYGFVVIASNSTWTNSSNTNMVQLRALDYAKALNEDSKSIFYQKLDMEKIGAMGHSQGAAATNVADADPRVKAVIFWNSGNSNDKPFLNVSGDRDVGGTATPASLASGNNAATKPGAWVYYHKVLETGGTSTGHLVLMEQPERVVDMAVAWWKWQLNGDAEAKKMFVGDSCGLCNMAADFEYGHNTMLQ